MPGPLENPNIKKFYQQARKPFNYVPSDLVSGYPTIPPMMSGLMRIDPDSGNIWISAGNTLVSDWKLITGGGGGGGVTSIIAGTNISITSTGPGGTGAVTINSSGGGSTYNGDQGVYKDASLTPETFMLGAPLGDGDTIPFLEPREIDASEHYLYMKGINTARGTNAQVFSVEHLADGIGIYAKSLGTQGVAVYASTNNSKAIYGEASDFGTGVWGRSVNYLGLYGVSDNGSALQTVGKLPNLFYIAGADPNTTYDAILMRVSNLTGPAIGFGVAINFTIAASSSDFTSSKIASKFSNVTVGNEAADLTFSNLSKGAIETVAQFNGNADNQLQLNKYGLGNFNDTPVYSLGVDASGNVVEYSVSASGLTIMVGTAGTFNVDSTWNDITPLSFGAVVGKSYSFKAVISYSILNETDGGTIWAAIDDGIAAYGSSSYYCQVWNGSGLVTYPSNEVQTLPPTTGISSTTYSNRSNIAIVEGVISDVTVGGTIKIQGLGKSGGIGGNTVTYNEGSSLTVYELP